MTSTPLATGDVLDLRAYETERAERTERVRAIRRRRRVTLGPLMTASFENRDTVLHQIHEMLRAERSLSPGAVRAELDAYNPLLPANGELSLTLMVEVTDPAAVKDWLGRLAGLENSVSLALADGTVHRARPEEGHRRTLTRTDVTAAVHYLRIPLPANAVLDGASLVVDHPEYAHTTPLREETVRELATDLATDLDTDLDTDLATGHTTDARA